MSRKDVEPRAVRRRASARHAGGIAAALGGALIGLGLCAAAALASSHSEAPGTAKDRLADDTDLYAFVSPDAPDKVTFVGLWIPLIEPSSGPNFYAFDDEVEYYFNIDNMGDCLDHIRYRVEFNTTRQRGNTFLYADGPVTSLDDPNLNVRQTYTVTRIVNGSETQLATGLPVVPAFVGPNTMPNYNRLAQDAVQTLADGTKIFVGPRDDPFFIDLAAVFDLLQLRVSKRQEALDTVAGFDVMAIVMQVPMRNLTRDGLEPGAGNGIIGIYSSAERQAMRTLNSDGTVSLSGPDVQVSRLGMPLVNEVVIGLQDKDRFNGSKPTGDGQFLHYVTDPEVPQLLHALFGIDVPPAPRNDLVTVFLTGVPGLNQIAGSTPCEMLRLNMTIPPAEHPKRLAVLKGDIAGFPNGRRLGDDVVDITLRVAAGVLVPGFDVKPNRKLSDEIDFNDVPFLPRFPYVAPPHNPFSHEHDVAEDDAHKTGFSSGADADEDADAEAQAAPAELGTAGPAIARTQLQVVGANPAAASHLRFSVPKTSHVRLEMYDARGRRVRGLIDQDAAPGTFDAHWDGRDDSGAPVSRGLYFARFTVDGQVVETKKVAIVQ